MGCYFHDHLPVREAYVADDTSWSCFHGVNRWEGRDDCAGDQNDWKMRLRQALNGLAARIDTAYERAASDIDHDPWNILEHYVQVRLGQTTTRDLVTGYGASPDSSQGTALATMMECEYYRQLMFTSCGFFFEDLDRIEPYNNLAFAAKAVELAKSAGMGEVEGPFVDELESARSWRTGRTARQMYLDILARR